MAGWTLEGDGDDTGNWGGGNDGGTYPLGKQVPFPQDGMLLIMLHQILKFYDTKR